MTIIITVHKIYSVVANQYNVDTCLRSVTFVYNNQNYFFMCPSTWSDQDIINKVKIMIGDPSEVTYQVNHA